MPVDNSQYCVSCNPSENWIQLEFRSEKDEAISKLEVTIVDAEESEQKQKTNSKGIVTFGKVALGQVGVFVSLDSLLKEVEKYPKRDKEKEPHSPVKERAEKEQNAKKEDTKLYRHVSIGDLWDEKPEDEDLVNIQKPLNSVRGNTKFGIKAPVNETTTYEVKAVRSLMPAIIDTDKFSLVNSYTFSLLATLAYATKFKNEDVKGAGSNGALKTVTEKFASGHNPLHASTLGVDWITTEIPYSQRFKYQYYEDKKVGSQAYALYNDAIIIIGVRGTETDLRLKDIKENIHTRSSSKMPRDMKTLVNTVDIASQLLGSPALKDGISDLDCALLQVPELGKSVYIHRGFYEYTESLWANLRIDLEELHANKKVYLCGHSLGGAGALILAAMIQKNIAPNSLRLFTYGMPRAGTKKLVTTFRDITHYRHVNDSDLVTQIPCKFGNNLLKVKTTATSSRLLKNIASPNIAFLQILGRLLMNNDDDNYHHHGSLVQLFAYSKQNQVLLLPSHHHIQNTDIALNGKNDSFALADALKGRGSIGDAVAKHSMVNYVRNLKKQLHVLSHQEQGVAYRQACSFLLDKISQLQVAKMKAEYELARVNNEFPSSSAAGNNTITNNNLLKIKALQAEIRITDKMLSDQSIVFCQLNDMQHTEVNAKIEQDILYGSRKLMTKEIAEQLP